MMVRILIQVPQSLKAKLDTLRTNGTTASGYVRSVLERELHQTPTQQKGR